MGISISAKKVSLLRERSDCLVLPLFENRKKGRGRVIEKLDKTLKGSIAQLQKEKEITGKWREITLFHTMGRLPVKRLMWLGLGKEEDFSLTRLRLGSGIAAKKAREIGAKRVTMGLSSYPLPFTNYKISDISQAIAEGIHLGLYSFRKYQSQKEHSGSRNPRGWVLIDEEMDVQDLRMGIRMGTLLAEAQNLARDLVNEPSNSMTPAILAERAREVAKSSVLKVEVIEGESLKRLEMGGFLGVSRGSHEPPKLILLRYEGVPEKKEWMALVGKGITFDTGGISIKPSLGMETMKGDMGGGAAVIAAMGVIGKLKPRINCMGIIPAAENMPSGHAYKPGDILKMMNGLNVEIISTDAEGRLILADGLVYAKILGATRIVDIATLTGGCIVALGKVASAVLGNDEGMIETLIKSSEKTGERMWQLPLFPEYEELMKSPVADLRNSSGTREASTICGGIFLKAFAPPTGWVHIDIAGKEMMEKEGEIHGIGGTGVGTRTLIQFVLDIAKSG